MKQQQKKTTLLAAPALCYAIGMLLWFPLCIHRYYDGSSVKFSAFFVYTLLALAIAGIMAVTGAHANSASQRFSLRSVVMLAAGASILVSTLASPAPVSAFWGLDGYLGGGCMLLLCIGGYLLLQHSLPRCDGTLAVLLVCGGAAVSVLAVANDFGLDPFHLYEYTNPTQYMQFFSTIGNVDYLNAFVCLWLPMACWQYLADDAPAKRAGWLCAAAAGFFGMALVDTGLATLGLTGAVLVLLLCVPLSAGQYPRLLVLAAVWLLAQSTAAQAAAYHPLQRVERIFSILPAVPAACAALGLLAAALLLWLALARRRVQAACMALQRGLAVLALAVLAAGFWLGTYTTVELGGLANFFRLDAGWGSERGAIFADMIQLYVQAPPLRRVFGYGMGMVAALMNWSQALPYPMWNVFGAHNEYLELLLATGLTGLTLWLVVLATHIMPALRHENRACGATGWALCLVAYSVQAACNNRVVAVFPVFAAMLGVVGAMLRPAEIRPGRCKAMPALGLSAVAMVGSACLGYLLFKNMLF